MANYFCFLALSLASTWLTATAIKNDVYECSTKAGYVAKPHYTTTKDGYILRVFRIEDPSDTTADLVKREPLLLLHGLTGSAEHFTVAGNESLAFYLANHGYDVWIGNTRGSFYSRNHTTLDPNTSKKFWEFSVDQHGKYDLPAMLDYVLKVTNRSSMIHIGYSQGSGTFFTMSAGSPEHNKKVKLHLGLAPGVYGTHTKLPLVHLIGTNVPLVRAIFESIHFYEIPASANSPLIHSFFESQCGAINPLRFATCPAFVTAIEPVDHRHLSMDAAEVYVDTQPAGACIHQVFHYSQIAHTRTFGRYDWGAERNLEIHNSIIAEEYDLSRVTPPVAIFNGKNDGLIPPEDVARLVSELPNVVTHQEIANEFFCHVDFIIGKDLNKLVNEPVLAVLNKFRD